MQNVSDNKNNRKTPAQFRGTFFDVLFLHLWVALTTKTN